MPLILTAPYIKRITDVVLEALGRFYSWGDISQGQLGWGTNVYDIRYHNTPYPAVNGTEWKRIVAGNQFVMLINKNNELYSIGRNDYGQLGRGVGVDTQVQAFCRKVGDGFAQVACGQTHSAAIKTDGTLWSWGRNDYYQITDSSSNVDIYAPYKISNDTFKSVACGDSCTLAIKTDGTLWGRGRNANGRLGDGTSSTRTQFVQIGTDTDWEFVFSETSFCFGIKTDGSLWAWGLNSSGQLGKGNTLTDISNYSPVRIGTDTKWKTLDIGSNSVFAIKTDGTLWSWGANTLGSLGRGLADGVYPTPTKIGTDTDWKAVSSGNNFTLALKIDGSVWVWGVNGAGQLGIGNRDTGLRFSPMKNPTLAGVSHIAAASNSGYAII